MTENTQINNTNEQKIETQSQGGDKSRSKTSIFIALAIVPIILLATLNLYVTDGAFGIIFSAYNILFEITMLLGLLYCLHELINFVKPSNENSLHYLFLMVASSITVGLPMAIGIWNQIFTELSATELLFNMNINSLLVLLLLISLVFLMVTDIEIKDTMLVLMTSLLFYGFFTGMANITINGGWELIFMLILITVVSDTMAYFGGKKYGSKNIFPKISPKKTKEGFLIGLFSAIVFGIIWFIVVYIGFGSLDLLAGDPQTSSIYWLLLVIVVVSIIAPFGDLYFSKIKRTYGKKDFSNLLPGHGGILDRIDSHIFVISAASILFLIL